MPKNVYSAQTPISGVVKQVHVEDGDAVNKQSPILTVETQELDAQLQEALERLQQAQARLRRNSPALSELQEQIALTEALYEKNAKDYKRYQRLWKEEAVSKNQYEMAKLKKITSAKNLARAKAALAAHKDQLKSELTAARGAFNLLSARETNFVVRSKIDGMAYEVYPEVGELVSPQAPVARLGQDDAFFVELQIDEADINKVQTGQAVLLRLENYAEKQFDGRVQRIYPLLNPQSQTFRVDVNFNQPPKRLYPGVSVEANIITAKRQKALLIPKTYLHPGDSVWVKNAEGEVTKRKVTTGISDMEMVEITDGLLAEDVIYETQP